MNTTNLLWFDTNPNLISDRVQQVIHMKSNIYIYLCISHSSTHKHQYKLQLHLFHSTFQSFSALSWAGYTVCLYQDRRSISISSAPPYLSHLLQIHTLFNLSLLLLSSSSSVHPGSRLFQLPSLPPFSPPPSSPTTSPCHHLLLSTQLQTHSF